MKRISCIAVLMIFTMAAGFCEISNDMVMSKTFLKNQGFSDEMIRVINLQKYDAYTARDTGKLTGGQRMWQKIYAYIDPGYDNGNFGDKNIIFKNTWDEI